MSRKFRISFLLTFVVVLLIVTEPIHGKRRGSGTKISKEKSQKADREQCEDKAKWCPCMTDDCHKSKVAKKCPSSCNTCSDEAAEEKPGGLTSHWDEIIEDEEEEDEEIWDEIEEDTEENGDDGDDDDEDGMPGIYDCRDEIRELHCGCLATVIHKKFLCYDANTPNFGKYDSSRASHYHHYCYDIGHQKERGRKQCCKAAASFREIRDC